MGDSFTFGYGVSAARRWTALCGQMLGMELVNCAVSGNTTGGMLARLEYQMDRVKPGMVLLMGGFNDILLSGSDAAARSNLGAMGHITAGRGAIPVFGTVWPIWSRSVSRPQFTRTGSAGCAGYLATRCWISTRS